MTKEDALKVLAILKAAYPNSYRNITREDASATATVWASQFAQMPARVVMIAVNKWISTNPFPPSINEVKEKIRGLYWECWGMLDEHKTATVGRRMTDDPNEEPVKFGTPLPENVVAQLEEIMAIVEPMRTKSKLEPTLGELLEGFSGYLSGGSRDDMKQLQ